MSDRWEVKPDGYQYCLSCGRRFDKHWPDCLYLEIDLLEAKNQQLEEALERMPHHKDCNVHVSYTPDMPEPNWCTCGLDQYIAEVLENATGDAGNETTKRNHQRIARPQ
jgi:hypothetical protein